MNSTLAWSNLIAYSLQIGLLIGIAAMVPALLRLRLPKARLVYWHLLLVACLLLPQTRPWKQAIVTVRLPAVVADAPPAPMPMPKPATTWPAAQIGLLLLAAGVAGRLGWLAVGLFRLRRYRLHSTPWRGPNVQFGVPPDYRISRDISSPVTFGWRNPVVLLPETFRHLPAPMQETILCHEALHVERHDWLFTFAEELVRAAFWFHPAIWWLLGEIQLAREQAVDQEVVARTQARDAYVDALLAAAGARLELDLAPAPLFLRKRHLRQRVVTIFNEVSMSKLRLFSTFSASLAILASACWFVTAAFPLAAQAQVINDAPGVAVDLAGAQLMHRGPVSYPAEARVKAIQGTVVAQVRLDSTGAVVDATVLSGPDELRKPVLQSLLNWHFSRDYAGSTRQVTVEFQLPKPAATGDLPPALQSAINAGRQPALDTSGSPAIIKSVTIHGLSDQAQKDLLASLPVHIGDTVTPDSLSRLQAAARAFDEHLQTLIARSNEGEVSVIITAPITSGATVSSTVLSSTVLSSTLTGTLGGTVTRTPAAAVSSENAPQPPNRIQIGGNVQAAMLISGPPPVYPALAKQAHISGVVHLHVFIGKEGSVESAAVIPPAHPLLAPAALDAVRSWTYKPTLLNGQPVAVETTVDISFMLANENQ